MRHLQQAWLAAVALAVWGCGGGGGGSSDSGSVVAAGAGASGESSETHNAYENGHPIVVTTSDPHTLNQESEIVRIVNEYRVSIGRNALVDTKGIADVARAHSDHMVIHNFFAHNNPEGDSPGARLTMGGNAWNMAGENLAAGFSSPESAFDAWMNSPGHKENIERPEWVYTGVGYWYDPASTYGWYWTQNFTRQ